MKSTSSCFLRFSNQNREGYGYSIPVPLSVIWKEHWYNQKAGKLQPFPLQPYFALIYFPFSFTTSQLNLCAIYSDVYIIIWVYLYMFFENLYEKYPSFQKLQCWHDSFNVLLIWFYPGNGKHSYCIYKRTLCVLHEFYFSEKKNTFMYFLVNLFPKKHLYRVHTSSVSCQDLVLVLCSTCALSAAAVDQVLCIS